MRKHSIPQSLLRRLSPVLLAGALSAGAVFLPQAAQAQQVIIVEKAPPAPQVEVIPVAPSPRHFWIHGYWGWNGAAHYWVPGRYELIRPGWGWSESRWVVVGGRYHFYPGYWYQARY